MPLSLSCDFGRVNRDEFIQRDRSTHWRGHELDRLQHPQRRTVTPETTPPRNKRRDARGGRNGSKYDSDCSMLLLATSARYLACARDIRGQRLPTHCASPELRDWHQSGCCCANRPGSMPAPCGSADVPLGSTRCGQGPTLAKQGTSEPPRMPPRRRAPRRRYRARSGYR